MSTNTFPSFTVGDIQAMPRRPVVSSDILDSMRYIEVTGIASPISGRELGRLINGMLEWRYLNNVMRTDIVALMPSAASAREVAARINGLHYNESVLKATVSDRWPASTVDLSDRVPHVKELRSEDPNSSVIYYSLPKESVVESQRRLGLAIAAKNETFGVSANRWVDSRDPF